MKASVNNWGDTWVVQLHDHDIAAQGVTREDALDNLRLDIAGHQQRGDFDRLPFTPSDILDEFGGVVIDL